MLLFVFFFAFFLFACVCIFYPVFLSLVFLFSCRVYPVFLILLRSCFFIAMAFWAFLFFKHELSNIFYPSCSPYVLVDSLAIASELALCPDPVLSPTRPKLSVPNALRAATHNSLWSGVEL